ncbi:hypothetical protein [Streptomyces sp. NPDC051662]
MRILPDDGGDEVDAHVARGMAGSRPAGEPGTVIPAPAPSPDDSE